MSFNLKKIGMWTRIFLLSMSVLAVVIFLLWQFGRPLVDRVDNYFVKAYVGYHKLYFSYVTSSASKEPQKGIDLLRKFLDDLSDTCKSDRLDPIKRNAYENLITLLSNAGRNEEALVWAEEWIKFDDRDLFAQVWRAKLMRMVPSRIEDGFLFISELKRKFPASIHISNEYVRYLIARGRFTDAFIAMNATLGNRKSLKDQPWQIFWDTGKGFSSRHIKHLSPTIDAGKVLSFGISLPSGVIRLRIDPPGNSIIHIIGPTLFAGGAGKGKGTPVMDLPVAVNQMTKNDHALVTSGGEDPFFWFKLPSDFVSKKEISFACTFEEKMPEVMGEIIEKSDHDAVAKELQERKELDALRQFRRLVAESGSGKNFTRFDKAFFELFWSESGKNFSEQRKLRKDMGGSVKDEALEFDVVFDVNSRIENIRIDFPGVVGAKFLFNTIELVGEGWSHQIDTTKTGVVSSHNVVQLAAGFVVRGNDPYIVFPPLPEARVVKSVIIRGAAF